MLIEYEPRGSTGYICRLRSDPVPTVTIEVGDAGISVEVTPADHEELPTTAVVASLERYADHEFAARRTRNEQARRHHRTQAVKWRKAAEDVAELLRDLTYVTADGWCSDCLTLATHRRAGSRSKIGTRRYVCTSCGSPTGVCDVPRCRHFADRGGAPNERSRFCAEHAHLIPSFEKLTEPVASIEDYVPWLEFERFNARRLARIAGTSVAGVAVVAPLALVSAPAIGGAIGASTGLSGAAATSHGLALLGGGPLAAGGLGMAGGTAVVTAIGGGLGGASGAGIASAYARSDRSFSFEKLADGDDAVVMVANGFLSEGQTGWGEWERMITSRYPGTTVYRVSWGALKLPSFASGDDGPGRLARPEVAAGLAARAAMRVPLGGSLGGVLASVGVAKTAWSVARTRASMTGAVLADAIVRADLREVVLVGFSLGARVMTAAAETLATRHGEAPRIQSLHLLGAAVGTRQDWHGIEPAIGAAVFNYHSTNDRILRALYRAGESGAKAIGCEGVPKPPKKVKNVNVSSKVDAHHDHFRAVTLR